MDINKDLVAASSTPLVLAILAEGDSYGYAIIRRVREISGGELEWTDGMLYPVLHRLERAGLIAARWEAAETGRQRKYYHLTDAGRRQLAAERRQWEAVDRALDRLWALPSPSRAAHTRAAARGLGLVSRGLGTSGHGSLGFGSLGFGSRPVGSGPFVSRGLGTSGHGSLGFRSIGVASVGLGRPRRIGGMPA